MGSRRMGSKRFKGKTCVYCAVPGSSVTGDHVIAREFFPVAKRGNLPVVPSCTACNNEKSRLEHYALAVLPFGATHMESYTVLSGMVPPRLAKNLKLVRALSAGMNVRYLSDDGGENWRTEMTLPLDAVTLQALFQMIARGLAFAEWEVLLPESTCIVLADYMGSAGRALFDQLFALGGNRVERNLGDGIFVYDGAQSFTEPLLTVWRMTLGGAVVSGDPKIPTETASVVYAVTAPRQMSAANELARILQREQARLGEVSTAPSYTYRFEFPPRS